MKGNAAIVISDMPFYWVLTLFALGMASIAIAKTCAVLQPRVMDWAHRASRVLNWIGVSAFSVLCVTALVAANFPLWLLIPFYAAAFADGIALGLVTIARSADKNSS